MSDDEEYEYENAEDDEEYNYEDGDEEEEVHSPVASAPPSATKTPGSISKASNPPSGTKEKNSLIRENSTSYELVVPLDSYVIRPLSDIKPLLEAIVSEVSVLLDITEDEAQTLLQQFKWDKEKLMDKYFNKYEQVRKDSGLDFFNPEIIDKLSTGQLFGQTGSKFKCRICHDEEADLSDSFTLGCNHHFCKDCYGNYMRAAVSDGPTCVSTHCPEHKCKQTITKSVFHFFLTDPDERDKYDGYFLRNFIEKSKNMKYCPAPRCERVAIGSGITTVKCSCSFTFCFKCGEEAHDPCSCAQLTEWTDKCMNESETANWILANTRKCPSCTTRIEKNQGCNHMTCKVCKHEFCWICMGSWAEHGQNTGGFYKCNRYDPSDVNSSVNAAQKAKAELDRYLHYYQRYHGHSQGLKYAANQRAQVEQKMVEQQESSKTTWNDVQFLKQAAEQVIECRRVLKYTYVLGYFLKDSSTEKQLFEHHQEMLEKNVEKLHEYTERPVHQVDRSQVVNLTRVTEKFLSSLLQNMTGGVVRLDEATMVAVDPGSSSSAAAHSGKESS